MQAPFIGAEALASGALNRHRLRTDHYALFPGVYQPKAQNPTLRMRTVGAWLWSNRQAVIAGAAAAAIHGSKWVDDDVPIELISPNTHPPSGLLTRNDILLAGEVVRRRGMAVTSAARTAFDLGRQGPLGLAVARLDALCRATGVSTSAVDAVAEGHAGVRGMCQLRKVLSLVDPGAESPKETWLRLIIIRAGIPAPTTQILVVDGGWAARLDMGWKDLKVAVEYDGDQHRTDRGQYVRDIRRLERLQRLGWIVVRVVAEDHPDDVIGRVRRAIDSRSRGPGSQRTHRDDLAGAITAWTGWQS